MDNITKDEIKKIAAEQNILVRDARRIALTRIEESARTEADFENLTKVWKKVDATRERKERWHVKIRFDSTEEVGFMEGAVIPQPLDHRWWRQMMHGLFIDIIFDCPYDTIYR